jgi:hypothetical protein
MRTHATSVVGLSSLSTHSRMTCSTVALAAM